ncbi:MAG: aminofutalosine synthase MqnE [Saprospiraceae bacterium]|nr:aminofutalosine synthase MqnE [Saprospiraceae bacterium]MCB9322778.1 aminofutalosine synthase MqnE [Lewinellaceae bacterium]
MKAITNLNAVINDKKLPKELRIIAEKVSKNERITTEEGVLLFEKGSLAFVGSLANFVRQEKNGKTTWFNRNFHIEPTNVCLYTCKFCSYSRMIKQRGEGWEYSIDEIMEMVKKYDDQPVTEVHIVGGVLPQYDFDFYTTLYRQIKAHRPELHIKALTPVEYHYIFKKAKISYEEGMKAMHEAGLDSLPGGGAEIFDEALRDEIAGGKCSSEEWLRIHEIWHEMGLRSNATILYGHVETFEQRIDHMNRLRALQDKTGGFQTFIPLKFRNKNNEMSHVPEVSVVEDLRNYAISRIFLDNFDHIKAYWPMIGRTTAQLSLDFGVDDLDGTIDDTTKIYSMAGSEEQNPAMSTEDLVKTIRSAGYVAKERDTLYNIVRDFTDYQFEDDKVYKGYVSLPVVNN